MSGDHDNLLGSPLLPPTCRYWPPVARPATAESVFVHCPHCAEPWQVHQDIQGYRFRCECGEFIQVPKPVQVSLPEKRPGSLRAPVPRARGTVPLNSEHDVESLATEEHGLSLSPNAVRNRVTMRTLVELSAIVAAFWGPACVVELGTIGDQKALYRPFASLVSAGLILMIGCTALGPMLAGLKRPRPGYFASAVLGAAGFAVIGLLMTMALLPHFPSQSDPYGVSVMGLAMSMFCIAFVPAVFEELSFRGILQHRLKILLGHRQGLIVTATAFGLAHGITLGLPIQFAIGYYLSVLREKSDSLFPGMLVHLLYNGTLVIYYWSAM